MAWIPRGSDSLDQFYPTIGDSADWMDEEEEILFEAINGLDEDSDDSRFVLHSLSAWSVFY